MTRRAPGNRSLLRATRSAPAAPAQSRAPGTSHKYSPPWNACRFYRLITREVRSSLFRLSKSISYGPACLRDFALLERAQDARRRA